MMRLTTHLMNFLPKVALSALLTFAFPLCVHREKESEGVGGVDR